MDLPVFFGDVRSAYSIILYLFVAGQLVSTLEFLFIRREFSDHGAFPWKILRFEHQRYMSSALANRASGLYGYKGVLITLSLRILALILILFCPIASYWFTVCALIIAATLVIMQSRQIYGGEGSDQMSLIISICLLTGGGVFFNFVIMAGLIMWFIAAQSCLSYTAAGVAKLGSAKWRSGNATFEIFNTTSHGSYPVAHFLSRNHTISFVLSWSAMVFESGFAICLITPWPITAALLLMGVVFHLVNAIVMGLNSFLWIFIATYPAIIFTASCIHHL